MNSNAFNLAGARVEQIDITGALLSIQPDLSIAAANPSSGVLDFNRRYVINKIILAIKLFQNPDVLTTIAFPTNVQFTFAVFLDLWLNTNNVRLFNKMLLIADSNNTFNLEFEQPFIFDVTQKGDFLKTNISNQYSNFSALPILPPPPAQEIDIIGDIILEGYSTEFISAAPKLDIKNPTVSNISYDVPDIDI